MQRQLLSIGLFAVVFALFAGVVPTAFAEASTGSLTTSARAEIRAEPDMARFGVGVETRAETAEEARELNARSMNEMQARLLEAGAEEKLVKTSSFNVSPDWHYNPSDGSRTLIGYVVSHSLEVTVTDLEQLGTLLDVALQAGATRVNGPTFGLSNQADLEAEVLTEAVRKARKKADVIAAAAGVFIKRITHISESVNAPFGGAMQEEMAVMRMSAADSAASTSISPGEISITANVNMTFEI